MHDCRERIRPVNIYASTIAASATFSAGTMRTGDTEGASELLCYCDRYCAPVRRPVVVGSNSVFFPFALHLSVRMTIMRVLEVVSLVE